MRFLTAPVALMLAACASGGGSAGAGPVEAPQTTRVETATGTLNITRLSARGISQPFNVPLQVVWARMPDVYGALEIPVTTLLPAQHTIGNESFRVRRTLGGQRLSRYLNCGSSLGEQNADSYSVLMSITSRVTENRDGQAILTTVVEAQASPSASTTHRGVLCSSTGELERRMEQMVRESL